MKKRTSHKKSNSENDINYFKNKRVSKNKKQKGNNFTFPDGGWVCSQCKNYNFYGRTKCNRCHKYKSKKDFVGKPKHLVVYNKKQKKSHKPRKGSKNKKNINKKRLSRKNTNTSETSNLPKNNNKNINKSTKKQKNNKLIKQKINLKKDKSNNKNWKCDTCKSLNPATVKKCTNCAKFENFEKFEKKNFDINSKTFVPFVMKKPVFVFNNKFSGFQNYNNKKNLIVNTNFQFNKLFSKSNNAAFSSAQ